MVRPKGGLSPYEQRQKEENERKLLVYLDKHGRVPVGTLGPAILNVNSPASKQKIVDWLNGWHGREDGTVTLKNYLNIKLPDEYLDYNELRHGPTPGCSSCQKLGRVTPLSQQWAVHHNNKHSCVNVTCIKILFSNSQKHRRVQHEKVKEEKTEVDIGEGDSKYLARAAGPHKRALLRTSQALDRSV